MIHALVAELGPWTWWIIGLILLGAEILMPGIFLLWIGLAAIVIGAISFALWEMAWWNWQVQLLVFAVLALLSAYIGHRFIRQRSQETDQPLLNRRMERLVGRTATLLDPIENGRGRIRLDDTAWVVSGPDLPAGTTVRISDVRDGDIHVEPV